MQSDPYQGARQLKWLQPLRRKLSHLFSSCEAGWISSAFALPAAMGCLTLLLYVDGMPLQQGDDMAGFDVPEQESIQFAPLDPYVDRLFGRRDN